MQRDSIDVELTGLAFEFFFRFSRFEFALKENGYLKSHVVGSDAKPGWDEFVKARHPNFAVTQHSAILLANPPERQIVGIGDALTWRPVGLDDCRSELEKIVRLLRTIRNNLFHGGKHGAEGWDDRSRTRQVLEAGQSTLEELAYLAGFEADFFRRY